MPFGHQHHERAGWTLHRAAMDVILSCPLRTSAGRAPNEISSADVHVTASKHPQYSGVIS